MSRGLKYFLSLCLFLISISGIVYAQARQGRRIIKHHGQEWLPGDDYGQDINVLNEELRRLKDALAGISAEITIDSGDTGTTTILIQDGTIRQVDQ